MKQFRFSPKFFAAALICAGTLPAQTGFPFQNETLRYSINYQSGLSLGEATMSASKGAIGWNFEVSVDAGVPGFAIKDKYRSNTEGDLCAVLLERETSHGTKKTNERTTFDKSGKAKRATVLPENGGTSEFDIPACPKDAIGFVYLVRREMGQGRMAPPNKVFFGSAYQVRAEYTGPMDIPAGDRKVVSDRVVVSVKGPKSDFTFEVFFARDPARTPLSIKIPVTVGTLSLDLVR